MSLYEAYNKEIPTSVILKLCHVGEEVHQTYQNDLPKKWVHEKAYIVLIWPIFQFKHIQS